MNSNLTRRTRRAAALLCLVLAGMGLGRGAAAQVEPQAGSPATPTPYQSPLFHSGGSDPVTPFAPPFGLIDPALLNPLYGQLQGTPTELVPGTGANAGSFVPVEIPSYDLGAYNPAYAPGRGIGTTPSFLAYYPDHLADGSIYSWQAPFNYIALSVGLVQVDDSNTTASPTGSVFALTGGWENPNQTTGAAAGTATNGEYQRLPPGASGSATWTLVATTPGSFSVYFHIPDQIEDSNGVVEARSTQVTYQIVTTGANAMNTTATVSQTEANSLQFLAGPFLLAVGDTVTVTLQRDNAHNRNTNAVIAPATTGSYLIADSMTLQTSIGDVRCAPAAINASAYPADFARAKYWGIYVPTSPTNPGPVQAGTDPTKNALPDTTGGVTPGGARLYFYGDPAKTQNDAGGLDGSLTAGPHKRLIRQLVYFGRQDPTFSNGNTVDDSNLAPTATTSGFTPGGFSAPVGDSTGTATNGEYRTATPISSGTSPSTATWSLIAPNGGQYYVSIHLPQTASATPIRIPDARYFVSLNGTPLSTQPVNGFVISQAQTGDVTLPTGGITMNKGDRVTVSLPAVTGQASPNSYTVIADSVRIATSGNGTGAIYCVDGFTGAVVWRFQTPGGLNGPSAPVFSSPLVTKINVLVTPAGPGGTPAAVYANRLVVIVGDDNGMVYCLDAIGNGDGTSNSQAIDPVSGLPIYIPQPAYGAAPPVQVDQPGYLDANGFGHVGTTGAYWIYRPDPNKPKYVTATGPNAVIGTVRRDSHGDALLDPNSDLPVPAAFSTASPNVFIDPSVSTTPDAAGVLASNAKVYIGNSNGVLYALDALGVPIDGTTQATYDSGVNSGDRFNASYDLRNSPTVFPATTTDGIIPTPQPLWWFTLRGADANSTANTSSADIESAPAIHTTLTPTSVTGGGGVTTTSYSYAPTVYIGSAHEMEATSNIGRLYALDGTLGPAGNNGLDDPTAQPNPAAANYTGPGSANYNVGQRPQINAKDATDWSFPDAYDRTTTNATENNKGQSTNKLPRPALGNITGSPVVFTDTNAAANSPTRTRVYFAANVGLEVTNGLPAGTRASARPADDETGRIWAVNLDGSGVSLGGNTVWSYPLANDPNNAALDTTPEPSLPIGAFLRATPALGYVQFPSSITENNDTTTYTHGDAVVGDVKGASVPMLYVGTRGVNDTALYAIDVHGNTEATQLIYRQISPDGSIFQSSPALITNNSMNGGNGGAVYIVGGNTLYDFSATPISNPINGQAFPLIRENKAYTGFGPISSPAIAAANTLDLLEPTLPGGYPFTTNDTDWIYVGDSSTGFCRGITPYDTSDLGIPGGLSGIVPPTANPPSAIDLQAIMQVYLVNSGDSSSTSAATPPALQVGPNAPLPVYDWGQSVYIRFKNVVPPADPSGDPNKDIHVLDSNVKPSAAAPAQAYGEGGPIEFDISDTTDGTPADHGTVPATLLTAGSTPLANGFYVRSDTPSGTNVNLVNAATASNTGYIGAYTYAIGDGTARRNTPGSRRHISNAKQTVRVYTTVDGVNFIPASPPTAVIAVQTTNGNEVSTPTGGNPPYKLVPVQPVDEPVFGILNPLAVRGGGIPLPLNSGTQTVAVQIGDELGPFRSVTSPISNAQYDLEALANGNNILVNAPNSTSGGGGTISTIPIQRNLLLTSPATDPKIVVTSTGLIPHNTGGDNFDAYNTTYNLPTGSGTAGTGLNAANFGIPSAPFAMDITDRSALGLRLNRLRVKTGTISGGGAGMYWNDNSSFNSALPNAVPTPGHDHDSVVNYLPWETPPPAGRYENGSINSSTDYPNISTSDVTATLYPFTGGNIDLTLGNAIATPATLGANGRKVYTNPVQFHITVPHYQPANQQLYVSSGQGNVSGQSNYDPTGEIPSTSLTSGANNTFPMGYVTTRRIYIPDQTGFYRPGAAYRDVRIYTGVPPDYGTAMGDSTVEVGSVPSGFGIQTSQFTGLSDAINNTVTFDPYNGQFQDYYKPLKIYNTGNVNLLNVHLDQKQNLPSGPFALPLVSDALDLTSFIPGFDNSNMTGPRFGMFGNVPEQSYLIRSSLDSDIVAAYGHNPAIVGGTNAVGTPLIQVYPGATFHKAQVGSGQPSTLYVPDSPEGFTPGATLDVPPTNHPTHVPDGNNGSLPFKTAPFVSVAVPFGMPVGSYHGSIQLFEGLDPGYPSAVTAPNLALQNTYTGLTAQIYPPKYGGAVGGIGTPNYTGQPYGLPLDTIQIVNVPTPVSLMPNSSNGAVLNVKVTEDRMTDGAPFGAVPMIDPVGAGPKDAGGNPTSTPDFAPAAFRDPTSGYLSVYWTSGRTLTGSTSPYNILSANVPFVAPPANSAQSGYFTPSDPKQYWWRPAGALAPGGGTSSGLSIAQDSLNLNTVGAFAVNVQAPPLTTAYQNTLLYYPVTAKTGVLGSPQPVTNDPTQVKYGVKGLFTNNAFSNSTPNLWAFWTATTRGRTAIYYNSQAPNSTGWVPSAGSNTPSTLGLLPIPAGLTAVADPAPMLMFGNVQTANGYQGEETIEVTYSGTAPDGNVDLYQSRYHPDSKTASLLDLVPFPAVTEVLTPVTGSGWYQARDVAWSRTSQFNMFVNGVPILYDTANNNAPLFSRAVFDKATGLLVLTGVPSTPKTTTLFTLPAGAPTTTAVTVYVDLATGRARFSLTPIGQVTAFFSPLARRMTTDSRADTGPVTFLDGAAKPNDAFGLNNVTTDRRWYIWRKSGTGGASASATIYYKTQRLTAYLPRAIDVTKPITINLNGTAYSSPVDVQNTPALLDQKGKITTQSNARVYFPISSGAEGATITGSYTATDGTPITIGAAPDTVQWQDEARSNDTTVPFINATQAMVAVNQGYELPLATPVNENNVAAFLDPYAGLNTEHKVWLFWNSTRNGTADVYYETINPLFEAQ